MTVWYGEMKLLKKVITKVCQGLKTVANGFYTKKAFILSILDIVVFLRFISSYAAFVFGRVDKQLLIRYQAS